MLCCFQERLDKTVREMTAQAGEMERTIISLQEAVPVSELDDAEVAEMPDQSSKTEVVGETKKDLLEKVTFFRLSLLEKILTSIEWK